MLFNTECIFMYISTQLFYKLSIMTPVVKNIFKVIFRNKMILFCKLSTITIELKFKSLQFIIIQKYFVGVQFQEMYKCEKKY
jgi:hypothetical protein